VWRLACLYIDTLPVAVLYTENVSKNLDKSGKNFLWLATGA
jgi:hypothetical protein